MTPVILGSCPAGTVVAPMHLEAVALRRGLERRLDAAGLKVRHIGTGPWRARRAGASQEVRSSPAVVLAGIGVALAPDLQPGDIVVADRVRADALTEGPVPATRLLPGAPMLAGALIRRGLRVHLGAVISTDRIADPNARERLAMAGVLAADRESAWVLSGRIAGRAACVRVVASSSSAGSSWRGGIAGLRAALRALPTVADGIVEWCEAGDRLCGAPTTSRPR